MRTTHRVGGAERGDRPPGAPRHSAIGAIARATAVVAVMSLGVVACGNDSNVQPSTGEAGDAQPTPGASFYTTGTFDDVPLPGGATEISAKTEKDGAITQSFAVTATAPQRVMDFFVGALADGGWTLVTPVEPRGTETLFGAWERDGRRLEVSAGPAPGIADDTQFSLVLLSTLEPGRDLNTAP